MEEVVKMQEGAVQQKSELFALRIVRLYTHLKNEKKETVISKQLLRSGTSIGANIAEAEYAISQDDFLAKLYISLKECAETAYWLKLLFKSEFLTEKEYKSINKDNMELLKLLTRITKTTKEKKEKNKNNLTSSKSKQK